MNTRDTKLFNCYTQSQQGAARILFTVWLLTSCSPDMALAAPKTEGAMVPATTATSPGDPSLASTPPTPPPGGILQLPPDSPGPRWGSSPAIEAALQRQPAASLRARTIDRLASRFSRPRPQVALRTQAGPVAEGDETSASSSQHPAAATAPGQVPELTQNLTSLYQADDKLPKLIEDDDTPEQRIADYYVKLQAVISESGAGVESAAARDKVVGEKRAIQIKEIFDALEEEGDKPAGRVLLLGGAGIGKTTLMHYISHQWAKGELWKDKYAYLFRVRLKELLNDSWQSAYDIEDLGEHPLACFIHHCLRNQRAQLPRSERNTRQLCKLEKVKSLLEDPASQPSTLLLVDGYDEIASQRQQGIVKEIVDAILDQRQVIMTSRPNAVSQQLRASFDRQVENQGLDQEGIGHYIDLQFGEKQKQTGQALKEFLTKNKQIIGMCEVPINTALLCIIWQDEEIREKLQKQVGEDFKLGALYEELVLWLGRRYLKKFQGRDHKELTDQNIFSHPEVKTLKEVAYRSFTGSGQEQSAGTLGIAGELIANTAQEQGTKIESVYSYGLFRAEGVKEALKDKTHYFIHLTFQEYLTALRLSEKLSAPQGEGVRAVARHIAEHRNEPRYLMTLKFLAGLVSKSDNKEVVQRFWEAVSCNVEGVLELGVASKVGLLMHLLAQSTLQGELDERIPNREQLQELVDEEVEKDLARWQAHLIDSGYQSAALVKKLRAVIYQEAPQEAAISSLSSALEIGLSLGSRVVEEEQSLAGHLEKLLDSSVWQVQGLAASKLSQALDNQVDPEQASGLLAKLLSLYGTANTAREALLCLSRLTELSPAIVVEELLKRANQGIEGSSALKLCAKLVEVNPELAEQVLATAQTGLQDEDEYVREEALRLCAKLVEVKPELAEQVLATAQTGLQDEDEEVREEALELCAKLAEVNPESAEQVLATAQTGLQDESGYRREALELYAKLVKVKPELAEQVLATVQTWVQTWIQDQKWYVRTSALELYTKLVEVKPELAEQVLAAAQTGIQDQKVDVRQGDLRFYAKLVEVKPELAEQVLATAQTGLQDQVWYLRQGGLQFYAKLVEVKPELAEQVLAAAQKGLQDEFENVRQHALRLYTKLVEANPELAEQVLATAQTGLQDQKWEVRKEALRLYTKLVEVNPELAEQVLATAQTGLQDQKWEVRKEALELYTKLVEVNPELAEQVLATTQTGLQDEDEDVRQHALRLCAKLVEVKPELADQVLAAAQTGLQDESLDVRPSALGIYAKLVEVKPELADQVLATAQTGLQDQAWYVRPGALELYMKLVDETPELAEQVLTAAQTGRQDESLDARKYVLRLYTKLVEMKPELAEQVLATIQTELQDEDEEVRQGTLELYAKLVEVKPELAEQVLATAQKGIQDQAWYLRPSALRLYAKLVEVKPELADQVLATAQTGLQDEDEAVRQRALELYAKLVEVKPELAEQVLATAQTGLQDEDEAVRQRALELYAKLVEVKPELADQVLATAQTGLQDESGYVRPSALGIYAKLVEVKPELADQVLATAQTGIQDEFWYVRQGALEIYAKLVEVKPELADQVLATAQTGIQDQKWEVRKHALELYAKLVEVKPELAEQVLATAQTWIQDEDEAVRQRALELYAKLVEVAPELADQVLATAQTGLQDEDEAVRQRALELYAKLVEVAPELADQVLATAQTGLQDEDEYRRKEALRLCAKLVEVKPELAEQVLATAQTGLQDEDVDVIWSSFELLRKLAATLVQPEIAENALAQLKKATWGVEASALQTASTFTKLVPASAQHWLELVPYGLLDEDSTTREAAISLGVALAFQLPGEAIIPMLLKEPALSVREEAKARFIQRLQDKTVTYSLQDVLVLDQLLEHSKTDSALDQSLQKEATSKLLELAPQVAKEAGLRYLNDHFDKLSPSPAITAFLKKVMHQTLADHIIDQLEAELITKCILEHEITATIAPGQHLFVLEDSRYQFKEGSEENLQKIVNSVIKKSKGELARQYRTNKPLFKNTGIGLQPAACDIDQVASLVNAEADLSTDNWHLSVMHRSDHHKREPAAIFLLLEQRNYVGEHVIKKITYDQGKYTLAYDKALNPNAIDTELREKLFGSMEYAETKPRYFATCYTLHDQAVQELLAKINEPAGEAIQNAYGALHQLALVACQADQDAAGVSQLASAWPAYVQAPAVQELKKSELLGLNPAQRKDARRDSLLIEDREQVGERVEQIGEQVVDIGKDVKSLTDILNVAGITDKAEINEKLAALEASNPVLYDYCKAFTWTMRDYIAAHSLASTGMFSITYEQSNAEAAGMYLFKQLIATGGDAIPFVGGFVDLLEGLIDATYEGVKTAQQANRVSVINRIIRDKRGSSEDVDLTISRAALQIAERKGKEIVEAGQVSAASTSGGLISSIKQVKDQLEKFKNKILGNYQLADSPQAALAIEDVLALLVRMYKEYETLIKSDGALYEQLAALVCTGDLSGLLSRTAVAQEDIAQSVPLSSPAVTQEDISQAESTLAKKESATNTLSKLKKKAGAGLWEARGLRPGKECAEFFEEEHVRRYIAAIQSEAISNQQIAAMRMVLFRHMCEGIKERGHKTLACATKFAEKYPELVQKLAQEFPNYFVSEEIARACIADLSLANKVARSLP